MPVNADERICGRIVVIDAPYISCKSRLPLHFVKLSFGRWDPFT